MPLPFSFSAELSFPLQPVSPIGPFQNGSNIYAVLADNTSGHIEVWKSTDGGNSWAEQDSADKPAAGSYSGTKRVFSAIQSGTTIAMAIGSSSATMLHYQFNMATDQWVAGNLHLAFDVLGGDHPQGIPPLYIGGPDGSGNYYAFWNYTRSGIMGTQYARVYYKDISGTGNAVQVNANNDQVHYGVLGALTIGTRIHFFYLGGSSALYHRSLSGGVLGTEQLVDGTVNSVLRPLGIPFANGTEIILPIIDSGGEEKVWRATSADNPTWSTLQTVSPTTVSDPELAGSGASDSGTIHLFWPDDTTQDIYRDSDGGTGTWGADIEWKDAVNVTGISVGKVSNAIGVLYLDGSTVKYDQLTLATGETREVPLGTITLTGFVPAPAAKPSAPLGSLALTGSAPFIAVPLPIPMGTLAQTGFTPAPAAKPSAPLGTYTLTGLTPSPQALNTAPLGSFTITGFIPATAARADIPLGSYALTGFIPDLVADNPTLPVPLGSLVLTGLTPSQLGRADTPLGAYTFSGLTPNPTAKPSAPLGSLTYTGLVSSLSAMLGIPLGSIGLTGFDPSGNVANIVPIGSLVLTGFLPTIDAEEPGEVEVIVPLGLLTLTGFAPGSIARDTPPLGGLSLTGLTPNPTAKPSAPIGGYTLTGAAPVTLGRASVPSGTLAITGIVPSVEAATGIPLGALVISGVNPTTQAGILIPLGGLSVSPLTLDAMALQSVPLGMLQLEGLTIVIDAGGIKVFEGDGIYLVKSFNSDGIRLVPDFAGELRIVPDFEGE